jgi:3-vinyl bacteriochlorophyllide hydratase
MRVRRPSIAATGPGVALYTPAERRRRDASPWTTVQAVLAPLQFLVFLVSLVLIARYFATGLGLAAASASVIAKTLVLYVIMVTGAIWEHEVFGQYLFAPAFFWEDVVSGVVIALHTLYVAAVVLDWIDPRARLALALAAYASYLVNATQFLLKLRAARRQEAKERVHAAPATLGVAS